jgi:dynamin 1-like protein
MSLLYFTSFTSLLFCSLSLPLNNSARVSLAAEKSYFLNHPQYRKIAQRCGTQYLASSLSKLLLHHIHESLPELRTKMTNLLTDAQKEMLSYGDPMLDESNNKVRGALLWLSLLYCSFSFSSSNYCVVVCLFRRC